MKTFKMTSDCEFEAEDIDDAIEKVREHLSCVLERRETDLIKKGTIHIRSTGEKKPS